MKQIIIKVTNMTKTKILFTLWFILVVIILGLLTTLGFMNKKLNQEYQNLETNLINSAQNYTLANNYYPEDNLEIIITKEELIKSGYLKELQVKKDVCNGYVVVTKSDIYNYKAYIKCQKYTTQDYQSNKLEQ